MDQPIQPTTPSTDSQAAQNPSINPAPITPDPIPTSSTQTPPVTTPEPIPAPATQGNPVAPTAPTPGGSTFPPQPSQPAGKTKGGMNMLMVVLIVLFVVLVAGGAYFLAKTQLSGKSMVYQQPTTVVKHVIPSPMTGSGQIASPTAIITGQETTGSVSGTLCYPSSMIPAGTITAKSMTTNKEFTKVYPGSQNGGGLTYTIALTPDSYHMKFTPTQYPTVIGYYTDYSTCVGTPGGANCSGQKTRPVLPVDVKAHGTVSNVNLCDYYYTPTNPPQF